MWEVVKVRWPEDPKASVHARWQEHIVAAAGSFGEALAITAEMNKPGSGYFWFIRRRS